MAKQLNKRVVIGLGLFGFAGMILVSVLMLRQLQHRDPKYFVQLAENAASQQQWVQAALFYNEAWERGGDAKFLVDVGEMLLHEGDIGKAINAWRQALVHQPDLLAAHQRQVDLLLQMAQLYGAPQRWRQVEEAADAMLRAAGEGDLQRKAEGYHAKGLSLLSLESSDPANAERGLAALTEASGLAPENVGYPIALARELIRQERVDEGEQLLRELIERNATPGPNAAKARLALAQHLAERQQMEEAERLFQQSLDSSTGDPAALREAKIGYATFLMRRWARAARESGIGTEQGLYDSAERILKECIEAEPEEFEPYLQMALLYKAAQRHSDVVDVCEKRIRRGLARKGVEATQNRIRMFTLMINASEACVALALKAPQAGEREQWLRKAEQYVADARGESPTHPRVLSQAGRVKLALGQDREALKDLRAADEGYGAYDSVNWENKIILAQVHLRLNEVGAAKAVLESVLDQAARYRGRDPLFWNLYAQVLFQNNELDRTLSICDRVLLIDAANREAKHLKAAVYERQGKHALAGAVHAELTGSTTVQAMLNARAAVLAGDVDTAVTTLRSALEQDPADTRLVAAAVNELVNLDRHDDALAVVERALQVKPADLRLQQLRLLARRDLTPQQRDDATLQLIRSEEDAFQRDLDLIMFHSRKEEFELALRAIESAEAHLLAKDTPLARSASVTQHAALLKAKIRMAVQLDNQAAMDAARDSAARHNVDGAAGKSLLGWYHLQRKEFELAVNAYREAAAIQPTDAISLSHLGQSLQMLGRLEEAEAAYEEAVRQNPNEGYAHQGLAIVAQARGDLASFRRELALCERLLPNDAWVQEQVIARTEEADAAAAVKRREARLAEAPDDIRNLQRLAILYASLGDNAKAEDAHARLMSIRPDDEKVVLAAATFYRRTGRPEKALSLVNQFAQSRTDPRQKRSAPLLIANEHVQNKKLDQAESVLLAAYEAEPSLEVAQAVAELYVRAVNQPQKALPWYERAIERAGEVKPESVPKILDAKIACLLNRAVDDLAQAQRDTTRLRNDYPTFVRGLLWESEIAARTGDIDRAVTRLGEYLAAVPNDAYALYQRARHLISRGRTVAAVADLETIKRTDPRALLLQPRLLLARLHLRAGRSDLWVAELESVVKDAPQSAVAVEALVDAYVAEKRLPDADKLVTAQINQGEQPVPARWYFLRGRVSLSVGDGERALEDFRLGAEASGFSKESVLQVLQAYLLTGKFAAGVEYFERLTTPPAVSALVSCYAKLLARAGTTAKAVAQFRRAMTLALAEQPSAVVTVANDVLAVMEPAEAVAAFSADTPEAPARKANERILARAEGAAGRTASAVARLDAILQSAANDAERAAIQQEKGDIYQTGSDFERAIESYEEALRYDAANWVTLNNIAYLLSDARKQNEPALSYALKAVALADNAFTLDTLGWIYVGLGRYGPAIAELSRAVRVDPDYALSYYHLGEAYRRNAQFVEAADVLKDGLDLARAAKDDDLAQRIDASLGKVGQRDAAP